MTGRDLIIYILSNNLENSPVFEDGTFLGFLTVAQVAGKMQVGEATVETWIKLNMIDHIQIGEVTYIPSSFELKSTPQPQTW